MTPVLLDTAAIAAAIGRPASTVYRWGSTGLLTRHGKDTGGRWLYRLDEAIDLDATVRRHTRVGATPCVAPGSHGADCPHPSVDHAPFGLCHKHAVSVYQWVHTHLAG